MKKILRSALSVILCCCMVFSACAVAATAEKPAQTEGESLFDYLSSQNEEAASSKQTLGKVLNAISNFLLNKVLLNLIAFFVPRNSAVVAYDDVELNKSENFFAGDEYFIDENDSPDAGWSLGYASSSILPDDFGEKAYARGSYIPWWNSTEIYSDEDGKSEDMKVRTIILDDGSGRGKVAFCVLDCIGIANADIRKIRASLAEFAEENNIISINVSSTHTHTGIDSQGAWTMPFSTLANNAVSSLTFGIVKVKNGIDETYLQKMIDSTKKTVEEACENMTDGDLTYASYSISAYTHDRTPPYSNDATMYRLVFMPHDERKTPTLVTTFGCHPEVASYDWLQTDGGLKIDTKLSPDFVYYMEKVANRAGYNFIFIQGDVGTITTSRGKTNDGLAIETSHEQAMRFGYELGYIALGMTMTEAECAELNTRCGDVLGVAKYGEQSGYSIWYKGWKSVSEQTVKPVLNIKFNEILVEMENNVAKTLTKSGIASNTVVYDWKTLKYYTLTEVGYMEIGDALKVFLCPGETFNELVLGGDCMEDFPYKSLRELYGDNLIVMDLMNDAVGYLEPDNYYVIAGYQYNVENDMLESDTWCLLVSMGKNAASEIIGEFIGLVDGIKRK